ncbi:GATA zinc finger domain-containing protein 8 OS=Dictyostelium discoideum GN=gtaH PE=4 SV=1 [Rhizoctonia solani AG-1 IB]|uniref:GATA zinc finger domain-containing protein 8 n=1 Tax=Thanatephorus cucumeris (strain AG1-IB / isolate 7/3/14) TaxID=1108050 RepID=A0A0B7FSE6_THACB|nr:GATA zinc finger domain-containing protein 8 OS=Dictyostelium discoideum GN=gtaH PE=4 SV=1 [Rhizoctonia solani AG-1 IB]
MSRPPSSQQADTRSPLNATPSRRPSPMTLAAANSEQAATSVPRNTSFSDGVLIILSCDTENIFVMSNLSYEHVLESALTNFSALKSSRVERSQIRLAVQTKIGTVDTLVQVTPDTWPAVATRAQVVTVLFQQPSSSPSQHGLGSHARLPPPPVPHRLASPSRELEPMSRRTNSPSPHHSTWHPPYPPTAYTTASTSATSPGRGSSLRPHNHSRQPSQSSTSEPSRAQYPYAQVHYIPATPNAVSPTTDVSFLGVRPVVDIDPRKERSDPYHTEPLKRRWDQLDDAGIEERAYAMGPGPAPPHGGSRPQFSQTHHHEDVRKQKRARAWNPPDHQYMCRRCHRTDSPAWRKGPEGPKTLCNACGLSYAKDAARREAAASASVSSASTQAQLPARLASDQPASYTYNSDSTNSNNSRSGRGAGVKTLDGSSATLSTTEGGFPGPTTTPDVPLSSVQPLRKCTLCERTDSPQWRKGPGGPNTLCNSCGLQWARTQRKSEGTHSRAASSRSTSPAAPLRTYQPVPPPETTIRTGASLAESATGRLSARSQLPSRSDRDDDQIQSPSAASHRSDSLENVEAQPSS